MATEDIGDIGVDEGWPARESSSALRARLGGATACSACGPPLPLNAGGRGWECAAGRHAVHDPASIAPRTRFGNDPNTSSYECSTHSRNSVRGASARTVFQCRLLR